MVIKTKPVRSPERYCPKATRGDDQCNLGYARKNRHAPLQVLSVAQLPAEEPQPNSKRAKMNFYPTLSFSEEDKIGTTQSHDDALLITLRI